jgi:hypothetical protein
METHVRVDEFRMAKVTKQRHGRLDGGAISRF